jgi:hypothetical protein
MPLTYRVVDTTLPDRDLTTTLPERDLTTTLLDRSQAGYGNLLLELEDGTGFWLYDNSDVVAYGT